MTTKCSDIYPEAIMAYMESIGGIDALTKYVNHVWSFLMRLKPGTRLLIDNIVKEKNKELFKLVVDMYQEESRDYSVQFNIDQTILRKKQPENAIH